MRIAYFTDTFLPQINGVATALANQARELGARGHSILIFTPKLDHIKRKEFKARNVQLVYVPAVSALIYPELKLGIFGLPKIIKHLVRFKPDIIHLHSPLTLGTDAIMAAKILNKPLTGTIHIYIPESAYLKWLKYGLAVKIVNSVVERYMNFVFAQCDLVLAPSKMLIAELAKNGFKKPVFYLPNGVASTPPKMLPAEEKGDLKKSYGLQEKVVLHFGRLSHEKNVDILIKSFYLLAKKHPNISLLIIGDGPTKKKLIQLTKKLKVEKQVVFIGFIEHQALISSGILKLGDVFATASTMENNPMAVLEAMMVGLPIVGVKQAGLIELVSSNGFLVKPGDTKEMAEKLEKILLDEQLATKMKAASLQLIKPYAIGKVIDKLLKLYRTL